eukprot:c13137_g1_i1.p1 GENE.c13137_g1_i1~~c13137_g1_i1.p1  ORF type:complete len:168 (-),score=33.24 c13137_g1_i1:26-502(-)
MFVNRGLFRVGRFSHVVGFIKRVKEQGSQALLGPFSSSGRFDEVLVGMNCVQVADGEVTTELTVAEPLCNNYGTMHGGATTTLIDVVGTMAILSKDHTRAGVSIELNCSFAAAARPGDELVARGKLLKMGKTMAFTQVDITRKSDGVLIATGRHTKVL